MRTIIFLSCILLFSCTTKKKTTSVEKKTEVFPENTDDNIVRYEEETIPTEILLQLETNVKVEDIEKNFVDYDLKVKKMVSKNLNIYNMIYNTSKIDGSQLIMKLQATKGVMVAEFNQKINLRNE